MILQFAIFTIGLALLWVGAELLIKNASRLASSLGVSPIIIGLSIVSLGTSAPELVVSIVAVIEKNSGISIGNIVGSNMANIGLILGIGALIYPMEIKKSWIHREVPFMILATIVFIALAYLGRQLTIVDGFILLAMMIVFLFYLGHFSAKEMNAFKELNANVHKPNHKRISVGKKLLFLLFAIIGAGVLILGSELTVSAGKKIALNYGVSDLVIGLTLVAVGTSLPELATTIIAAVRKETDIMVGNIIGSNIFNLLLIGGVVPIIQDIGMDSVLFQRQFPILLLLSLLVWPLMRIHLDLKRVEGLLLVLIYFVFVYLTF
jgi:cation:H+ antiporter